MQLEILPAREVDVIDRHHLLRRDTLPSIHSSGLSPPPHCEDRISGAAALDLLSANSLHIFIAQALYCLLRAWYGESRTFRRRWRARDNQIEALGPKQGAPIILSGR